MKPSEKARAVGFKTLEELSEISKESVQTLNNWSKAKPLRFELILKGAIAKKAEMACEGFD